MDGELFLQKNIKVQYQEFQPFVYEQLWGKFIPNLSVIDFLFNCGGDALKNVV